MVLIIKSNKVKITFCYQIKWLFDGGQGGWIIQIFSQVAYLFSNQPRIINSVLTDDKPQWFLVCINQNNNEYKFPYQVIEAKIDE